MNIELEYARDPVAKATGIELVCKFTHIEEEIPFFAMHNDTEAHGRDIYSRALAGEFGTVVPYTPPSAQEVSDSKRGPRMQKAIRKVQHYEMIGDVVKMNEWKQYYAEVYNYVIDPVEPVEISVAQKTLTTPPLVM